MPQELHFRAFMEFHGTLRRVLGAGCLDVRGIV
jgi:hypothetical protein